MELQLKFLTVYLTLFTCLNANSWQGTGNIEQEKMDIINSYIAANLNKDWKKASITLNQAPYLMANLATDFSTYLNSQWEPAWNVFISYNVKMGEDSDTVVYGYAFRDRWMWINGIKMNEGYCVSFIIWKDYNCDPANWKIFKGFSGGIDTSYSSAVKTSISTSLTNFKSQAKYDDIWGTAFKYINYLTVNNANFQGDKAFTIVMAQSYDVYIYGRFCAK